MVDVAQVKVVGLSMAGLIAGLRRQYKGMPPGLPANLRSYFDQEQAALQWYPLADYLVLMDLLLQVLAPKEQRLEACTAIGAFAGKRDAGGPTGGETPASAMPTFRVGFDRMQALPVVVRRTLSMRERYYNRGYYRVKRVRSHELEIELLEFPASPELCAISTGYLRELFVGAGLEAELRRTSCRGLGDRRCCWQLVFKPHVDTSSLVVFG